PIYLTLLGAPKVAILTLFYTLAIAFLMVSTLPVFSGKKVGTRVPPEMVLPAFVAVVLFVALLVSYPWEVLSAGTIAYIAALPLGWLSYQNFVRRDAALQASGASPAEGDLGEVATPPNLAPGEADRPERLN
ncbi:MAG: CDP-diacylglycerol--serine O-phosphatidyltransferase, partial [Pseudorhodoplanes sp.]